MSGYENYSDTSKNYDKTRKAIGIEVIVGCFALGPQRLDRMLVLDAGCGTGSYSEALLPHVLRIEAVDSNSAMIQEASCKLEHEIRRERVSIRTAEIDNLPFDNCLFDGIMINQVLHHLNDDATAGYPLHRQIFAEFRRVLKPDGVLVVNTCSLEQLLHGYWYYDLIPQAAEELRKRYIPLDILSSILVESEFTYRGRIVPTTSVLQGESYFDPRGPLSKDWRDGDSTWALANQAEIGGACEKLRLLEQEGGLADYLARCDRRRPDIGQVTFLHASRSRPNVNRKLNLAHTEEKKFNDMEISFKEQDRYSRRSILRSEKVYGYGFQSQGGLGTTASFAASLDVAKRRGLHVLEIGSGLGGASIHLATEYGAVVTGIDKSHDMVEISNERLQESKADRTHFMQGEAATREQFGSARFDLVWTMDCFLYIEDKKRAYQNILHWLKGGGQLFLTDFGKRSGAVSGEFQEYLDNSQYFLQDFENYRRELQEVGFSDVLSEDITGRFIELNKRDLSKFLDCQEDFLSEFDESELQHIAERWKKKILFAETGDLKWFMFKARSPC